jgi:hypothetical protein
MGEYPRALLSCASVAAETMTSQPAQTIAAAAAEIRFTYALFRVMTASAGSERLPG